MNNNDKNGIQQIPERTERRIYVGSREKSNRLVETLSSIGKHTIVALCLGSMLAASACAPNSIENHNTKQQEQSVSVTNIDGKIVANQQREESLLNLLKNSADSTSARTGGREVSLDQHEITKYAELKIELYRDSLYFDQAYKLTDKDQAQFHINANKIIEKHLYGKISYTEAKEEMTDNLCQFKETSGLSNYVCEAETLEVVDSTLIDRGNSQSVGEYQRTADLKEKEAVFDAGGLDYLKVVNAVTLNKDGYSKSSTYEQYLQDFNKKVEEIVESYKNGDITISQAGKMANDMFCKDYSWTIPEYSGSEKCEIDKNEVNKDLVSENASYDAVDGASVLKENFASRAAARKSAIFEQAKQIADQTVKDFNMSKNKI